MRGDDCRAAVCRRPNRWVVQLCRKREPASHCAAARRRVTRERICWMKPIAPRWAELERAGQPIGIHDMMIGGHARIEGLTVVTNNVREFRRMPGLRLENWLSS
jgi:hypothetical protein